MKERSRETRQKGAGRPGSPARKLAEALAAEGRETVFVQVSGMDAWGAELLPSGAVQAVLMTHGKLLRPGQGLDRTDCPVDVLDRLTPAGPDTPEGAWLAAAQRRADGEEAYRTASALFFPDGIMTEHGAVHWLYRKPEMDASGGAWQMEPVYDICTKVPEKHLNLMMTQEFAENAGCIPLADWRQDVWDSVSKSVAVLDWRGCSPDKQEMPEIRANFDIMFNGTSVPRTRRGFKAGRLWVEAEPSGMPAAVSCGSLSAVWASGMRGRLVCSVPVKIVELTVEPETGREAVRVRYPLSFDSSCPWVQSYAAAMSKIREMELGD